MQRMLVVGASLLALACQREPDLVVDLRTDLVCGVEFQSVDVRVDGAAPVTVRPEPELDFVAGVRLVDFEMLEAGSHHVEVTLRVGSRVVAERSIVVELVRTRAVTAVFTRSCDGVSCVGDPGDASRETCLGGSCVGGGCVPELDGAACASECTADADCATGQDCSAGRCSDGVCLVEDLGTCGSGLFCHPDSGCQPTGSPDCPAFMQAGDGYCIDIYQQGSMTWTDATAFCEARGGDLCTEQQWADACNAADAQLQDSTDDWEWTNDVEADVAGKSGAGGCDARSAHEIFVDPYGVRCCLPMP